MLLGYSFNDTALVSENLTPSHYDIARIKQLIKNQDIHHLKQGQTRQLNLSERDVDIILLTALSFFTKSDQNSRIKSHLKQGRLTINLSFKLPDNQYAQYSNVSVSLKNSSQPLASHLIEIDQLNFGQLSIPGYLLTPIWNFSKQYLQKTDEYKQLSKSLQAIQITQKQVSLIYTADWNSLKQLKQRGQTLLISKNEKYKIQLYQQQLMQIMNQIDIDNKFKYQANVKLSLSEILRPMFQLALRRSSENKNSNEHSLKQFTTAVDENKALLFVIAVYASGKNMDNFIAKPAYRQMPIRSARLKSTLRNRVDLMQHFSISAFLSSAVGDSLAYATGVFKEISDSKGGSGFSFADLAADRAGVEFGTLAIQSEATALFLQQHMSESSNEDDYMPGISHLPEGLSELTFKKRYGTTEDARYKKMQSELNKRILLCQLYNNTE